MTTPGANSRQVPPDPIPKGEGDGSGFPRERRLRKRSEFATVYSRGRSWSHPLLVLRVLPSRQPSTRFGFAVGKRVGAAVARNRLKRRLREAVRQLPIRPGYDIVIIGRPPARDSTYQQIQAALFQVLERGHLLDERPHFPLPQEEGNINSAARAVPRA